MAKLKSPLLSLEAHGKLADSLIFQQRRGRSYVRAHHKPAPPPSLKQITQRRITLFILAQWVGMSDADKAGWEVKARASGLGLTGYHYFLRSAQRDLTNVAGILAYWSFNEAGGEAILDYSGNARHATLEPTYPTNCPIRETAHKPKLGLALRFDGVQDHVYNTDPVDTATVTVRALAKREQSGQWMGIFCNMGTARGGYRLIYAANDQIWLGFGGALGEYNFVSSKTYPDDRWRFIEGTYHNEWAQLFIDGVLDRELDTNKPMGPSDTGVSVIGALWSHTPTSLTWVGPIAEVCILSRRVTLAEHIFLNSKTL